MPLVELYRPTLNKEVVVLSSTMNRRNFVRLSSIAAATIALPIPSIIGENANYLNASWFIEAEKCYDYVIGIHTGSDSKLSVISVLRIGKDAEPTVQVAELAWLGDENILTKATILGRKYGQYLPDGPLFSIEQVRAPGDLLQHQLKISRFRRFHRTVSYRANYLPKEGWYSTAWSRPLAIERLLVAHQQKWVVLKSMLLDRDLEGATYHVVNGKNVLCLPNADGDERVMATAIAYNSGKSWARQDY